MATSFFGWDAPAAPMNWSTPETRMGEHLNVMDSSWGINRSLGATRGAGEMVMPIELNYNNRNQVNGLFGRQWSSPQLESKLEPKAEGELVWSTPWGGGVVFKPGLKKGVWVDSTGKWTAVERSEMTFELVRNDNWRFLYRKGALQKVTAPGGRRLEYSYSAGNLKQVAQIADGNTLVVVEVVAGSGDGLAQSVTVAGVKCEFSYDAKTRRLTSFKSGGLPVESYLYDEKGVLAKVTPVTGQALEFKTVHLPRNKRNEEKVEEAKKPLREREDIVIGETFLQTDGQWTYDYQGRWQTKLIVGKDALGRTQTADISHKRGVMKYTDAEGKTTTIKLYRQLGLTYDRQPRQVIDAQGRVVSENRYDRDGNLVWNRDLAGNESLFSYDKAGRILEARIRYAGTETPELAAQYVYDAKGRVVRMSDASGKTVFLEYNALGDVTRVSDAKGRGTSMAYTPSGQVAAATGVDGLTTRFEYDLQGRLRRTLGADGSVRETVYNERGQAREYRLGFGNETMQTVLKRDFDALGRVASVTDVAGRVSRFEYDAQGRVAAEFNPMGVATRYEYDKAGRQMAFQIEKAGEKKGRTEFEYDIKDRLLGQKDAVGNVLKMEYDSYGRMVQKAASGEKQESAPGAKNVYDEKGRLTRTEYESGEKMEYAYNAKGQVETLTARDYSVRYSYDKAGRVVSMGMTGPEGIANYTYGYTADGQREYMEVSFAGESTRTSYAYDALGRLVEIRNSSMGSVRVPRAGGDVPSPT
ncbi:MAG: hypothetical protein SFY92_07810, partial [Verrucomicrobiae bacterium]|nr:hypothetical protein [Verrucomicrobiae bacterium]